MQRARSAARNVRGRRIPLGPCTKKKASYRRHTRKLKKLARRHQVLRCFLSPELACGESGIVHGAKCIAVLTGVA